MAYTLDYSLALGSSKTGLTLAAQLVTTAGANSGSAITTGFSEIGTGNYLWHYAAFADDFRGGVKFYEDGVPATILAFAAINPEETEPLTSAEVWANATRTLTQTAAEVASVLEGSTLTITRGDKFTWALTGLPDNTGYVSIDFMIKYDKSDADTDAVIHVRKNASGLTDGLMRLNGAALVSPVVAGDASITVVSSTALTLSWKSRPGAQLPAVDGLYYEYQYIFTASEDAETATSGPCNIEADVVRAIA